MPTALADIINQLERQKKSIEAALEALRGVDLAPGAVLPASGTPAKRRGRPPKRKGGMTPEGRARLAQTMKRRWAAAKRAGKSVLSKKN